MTTKPISEIFAKEEIKSNFQHDANNSTHGEQQKHKQRNQHQLELHQQPISSYTYKVNLPYDPTALEAGKAVKLI